ncbi:hypothetical protein ACFYNO_23510 [Kitasatospora sp. NPDC006697]|uniref:hypothetical protein n=1 Tax=Kitasatospora sp. NPDC006697 TaxID=3364020 RepID=UPI0036B5791C
MEKTAVSDASEPARSDDEPAGRVPDDVAAAELAAAMNLALPDAASDSGPQPDPAATTRRPQGSAGEGLWTEGSAVPGPVGLARSGACGRLLDASPGCVRGSWLASQRLVPSTAGGFGMTSDYDIGLYAMGLFDTDDNAKNRQALRDLSGSGFTSLVPFTLHVHPSGDLYLGDNVIAREGRIVYR